jgi:hypothetical protein
VTNNPLLEKKDLSAAGCKKVYINGSFVTAKESLYSAASFSRLKEIIGALGIDVKEKILLSREAVK